MLLLFNHRNSFVKLQVCLICLNYIKGKQFCTLLPPFNMNRMKTLVYVCKIK